MIRSGKTVLVAQNEVSGNFENIKSFKGAAKVTDGRIHNEMVERYFSRETGIRTKPTKSISNGDRSITVDVSSVFSVGDFVLIKENTVEENIELKIVNITGKIITLNRPIDFDYTTDAYVNQIKINMNVDGSSTPISFKVEPRSGELWEILRLIPTIVHSAAADDSKFGSIDALSRGVLFRIKRNNILSTYTQWFANSDLRNDMFDLEYTDKSGGGLFGTGGRWTFDRFGVVIDINSSLSDYLEFLIQDDLTSLNRFAIKAEGRIFV